MFYQMFFMLILCLNSFISIHATLEESIQQSRKLIGDLTHHNIKVLSQYELFASNIVNGAANNKISSENFQKIIKALDFAAHKHVNQTRKDADKTPYIIHPMGVANNIIEIGEVYDTDILVAALLHDTVEDTATSFEEIKQHFGETIESLVREVTDDKSLPKEERKCLQIVNASHKSHSATIVKLGDKLYNLTDLLHNPPSDWQKQRIDEYFTWAQQVINNLPEANSSLKHHVNQIIKTYHE